MSLPARGAPSVQRLTGVHVYTDTALRSNRSRHVQWVEVPAITLPNTKVRAHGHARKPNVRHRSMLCTKCSIHSKLPDPSVSYLQKTRKRQRYATDGHIHNCRRRVSHACMQKFKTPCAHLPSKHPMQAGQKNPPMPQGSKEKNAIIMK